MARNGNSGKMGLAICKVLVEAQAGMIKAESEGVERGTAIVIGFEAVRD